MQNPATLGKQSIQGDSIAETEFIEGTIIIDPAFPGPHVKLQVNRLAKQLGHGATRP